MMNRVTLTELQSSDLVLCTSPAQMAAVRERHARACQARGLRRWPALDCSLLPLWLPRVADDLALRQETAWSGLQVLGPQQERLVWERIVRESLGPEAGLIFDLNALARSAAQADGLCVQWQIDLSGPLSEEARQWVLWQSRFVARCQHEGWISSPRLHRAVVDALRCGQRQGWRQPARVVWLWGSDPLSSGTDPAPLSPLQRDLMQALQDLGVSQAWLPSSEPRTQPPARPKLQPCTDPHTELQVVAQWAHEQKAQNPSLRIGIAVPELAGRAPALEDALRMALCPEQQWADRHANPVQPSPFHIDHPVLLSECGAVQSALQGLRLLAQASAGQALDGALMGHWWLMPFCHAPREHSQRARLDALRQRQALQARSLTAWIEWVEHQSLERQWPLDGLLQNLRALQDWASRSPRRRLPSAWAETLDADLRAIGWCQAVSTYPMDRPVLQTWQSLLASLPSLDRFTGELAPGAWVALLQTLCEERSLPRTRAPEGAIEVVALTDLPGQDWDRLWVLGLDDTQWPPAPSPNPLLPAAAQRAARSPRADAGLQTALARQCLEAALHSSDELTVSWPVRDGDSERKPSVLLNAWVAQDAGLEAALSGPALGPLATGQAWLQVHLQQLTDSAPTRLEWLDDAMAPPVPVGSIPGGTSLLRTQAICPAWAFYAHRLGARALEETEPGLDPRERGNLVHAALQAAWQTLGHSQMLRQLCQPAGQAWQRLLNESALQALNSPVALALQLSPRSRQLEQARLERLLAGWLQFEAQRETDFEVVATEQSVEIDLAGLKCRFQIDRIDRLADGSLVVIDYKTGLPPALKHWAGDRIFEPQLPLYAAIARHEAGPVGALAFASVRLDQATWSGLGQAGTGLPNLQDLSRKSVQKLWDPVRFPDWASLMHHWRQSLHQLGQEVREGHAGVRVYEDALMAHCPVRPILRLPERLEQWQALS